MTTTDLSSIDDVCNGDYLIVRPQNPHENRRCFEVRSVLRDRSQILAVRCTLPNGEGLVEGSGMPRPRRGVTEPKLIPLKFGRDHIRRWTR